MLKRMMQYLQRAGFIPLMVIGAVLVTLWTANSVGAAPALRQLFAGPPPTLINYQGVVQVGGTPYSGAGYFKFAIVNSASGNGSVNYWANDGTASNEPATAVSLAVSNGLFNVLLGDTNLPGMSRTLDETVFSETNTYLRVWFSQNGTTFEALNPNQRIASVAYALRAKYAENGPSGPSGPSGPQGAEGPSGPSGLRGPTGPTGPQGNQGSSGPSGPQGGQGPSGPQGVQGASGPSGPQGTQGSQGPSGPSGSQGNQGPSGPQGVQGPSGPSGPQGTQGNQGSSGPSGPSGAQGASGPSGPQGTQGNQGSSGPSGPSGTQGPSGPSGPAGTDTLGNLSCSTDQIAQWNGSAWVCADSIRLGNSSATCNTAAEGMLRWTGSTLELCNGNAWLTIFPQSSDNDGDGYSSDVDCNDSNALIHPGATEVFDGLDNNCDGQIDEGFTDSDGDGYPAPVDCNDNNTAVHPGATEYCDGIDNNCDGTTDESSAVDALIWYPDADGDGYGDPNNPTRACNALSGYLDTSGDCDDTDHTIFPPPYCY